MHGESPAERARRLVVQELQLAARASEATRRARKRARESPPHVQQLAIRLAGIHRDSELRHLTAAHAHAENAGRLRRQAGEPDSTLARVYMSAIAGASGTCNAVLAVHGAEQPEAIVTPSDPLARAVHDLEATCGEGPARDAAAAGEPVRVGGDDICTTWPLYGPAVERMGIYDVTATPLRAAGCCLGTVTTLCWNPGGCHPGVPLGWLAGALVSALLDEEAAIIDRGGVPLAPPLDAMQATVHQAAGMVAAISGADIPAALDMIRAHAFARSQPAEAIADQIVTGRLDPSLGD